MIVHRYREARSRDEQPAEVISTVHIDPNFARVYGVTYADGFREDLFAFDQRQHDSHFEAAQALLKAFESYGVDISAIERGRRAAEQAAQEEALQRYQKMREHMNQSFFYSYFHTFDDMERLRWERDQAARRPRSPFNTGRTPPLSAAKLAALDKCRKLARLAASSTFAGERDNANRQKAKIMATHGIEEREL